MKKITLILLALALALTACSDNYMTDPVPEGRPEPVEWEDVAVDSAVEYSCTISVDCETILDNIDQLDKSKLEVLPEDGVIMAEHEAVFYKGESVFDVLEREAKSMDIHMEFSFNPAFNNKYLEGIGNLYEFDCGPASAWMYSVNDWYPNYGMSRYQLQDGDEIKVRFTCSLGDDIGGDFFAQSENASEESSQ